MTPLTRYWLLQSPGLLLALALLLWAWSDGWISSATAVAMGFIWVAKDALLYPFYRAALMTGVPHGGRALVGRTAVVARALDPAGQVRLNGERWQAHMEDGSHLAAGTRVRVVAAEGLTLTVRHDGDNAPGGDTGG